MTSNHRGIPSTSPDFVIPTGTQVVITESVTNDRDDRKKPGHVGVVIECPHKNHLPYTIRFADESEAQVLFNQMVLRRQEIDNLLKHETEDLSPHIIYKCQVGSKAFGLAHEESDDDFRGIFLPPASRHWSMFELPQQIEFKEGTLDEVYWELEKFIRLALKANPNILETLWTPVVLVTSPIAEKIRTHRNELLSKHLYKTYSGYVLSQFRRMKNAFEKTGTFRTKHAMHLIRLLHSGITAMSHGEIMIDVSQHRAELLEIKSGALSFEDVRHRSLELDRQFQLAFASTDLPEQPNFELFDSILIEARRSAV